MSRTCNEWHFFFTLWRDDPRDDISYTMKTLLAEAFARIASNELISDKYYNVKTKRRPILDSY